jgi:hypothetical protein
MTSFSTDTSYTAAKTLTSALTLAGNTYANKDWIRAHGGTWNAKTKAWRVPAPSSNKATAELLYALVSRGMQWMATR